jgi:ribonuclease-3 family protein
MCLKKKKTATPPPAAPAPLPRTPLPAPPEADPDGMNGLALAYIGDAVYELLARGYIVSRYGGNVQAMHEKTVAFSNAAFQAYAAEKLLPELTEAEAAAFKRGRNAHPGHVPKNKTQAQYHAATGLEALFGRLYLLHDEARMRGLFQKIVSFSEEFEHEKRSKTEKTEKREKI